MVFDSVSYCVLVRLVEFLFDSFVGNGFSVTARLGISRSAVGSLQYELSRILEGTFAL
jgi:hypothetical protein